MLQIAQVVLVYETLLSNKWCRLNLMLQRNASKFAIFYRIIFVDIDHVKLKDEQNVKQISNGI